MSFWDMGILIHITVSRCKYSFAFIFVSSVIVVACITLVGGSGSPLSLKIGMGLLGGIGGKRVGRLLKAGQHYLCSFVLFIYYVGYGSCLQEHNYG